VIKTTLLIRLASLEEQAVPEQEPQLMEVVFIDAATKQPTERLQLKLGVPLSPQHSRIRSRTLYR